MTGGGVEMGGTDTERRLRVALDAAVADVRPRPDAYARALAEWRRRERRRRLIGLLLACFVFALADGVGLWALNRSSHAGPHGGVVFDAPALVPPQLPPSPVSRPS